MIDPAPICLECARLQGQRKNRSPSCAAFPNGIPDAIYLGAFDHRSAYLGDKGILSSSPKARRRSSRGGSRSTARRSDLYSDGLANRFWTPPQETRTVKKRRGNNTARSRRVRCRQSLSVGFWRYVNHRTEPTKKEK